MPFALIFIGFIIFITAVQDTHKEFGAAVADDFSGSRSFIWFLISIFVVGAVGYAGEKSDGIQTFSRTFMILIVVALILQSGNKNLFQNFITQIKKGTEGTIIKAGSSNKSGGGGGGFSDFTNSFNNAYDLFSN